jgi:TPR repeat protein
MSPLADETTRMARTKGTIKVDARKTTAAGKKEAKRVAKRVLAAKKKKDACVLCDKALRYMYDEKKQDLNKARKLYQQAAKMGHADSMVELGRMCHKGLGGKQDYVKANEWFLKAARKGDAEAMNNLGEMYEFGQYREQDDVKAKEWYEQAARKGHPQAMYSLGGMYRLGEGGERDDLKAREWFEKAARKGDAEAMHSLGVMYRFGEGGERDDLKAREWFEKAARKGHPQAMHSLGVMYRFGEGGEQDDLKALEWYQNASNEGHYLAPFKVAYMYMYGHGVEQDYTQALELFQEASDRGDDGAAVVIGYMHSKGYGVPESETDAEEWYKKGAALDNPYAMWLLIDMCRGDERREDALALYQRVISIVPIDLNYFEGQDLANVRKAIADSREWSIESMQAPAVSIPSSSTILGKRRPIHTEAADTRASAVVLYRNTTKKPRVESTPEMRKSLATKIRKEMEQCRQKLDKVQAMNDDQIQQLYDDDSGSDLEGYPDEERRDDADKKWCNQQVLQAALTTPGRIVVLDAKYFGTSRTIIAGGVAATRITCPQLDAKTLDDMREEKTRDESLTDINLQEGSLGFHLNDAKEASIGVVFADYTGMWHSGPKIDMINLLENNKMRTDGKVFVTITLQRQGVESIFDAALDMLGGVFGPRGWSMFTSKTYKRMAFVGFRKSD